MTRNWCNQNQRPTIKTKWEITKINYLCFNHGKIQLISIWCCCPTFKWLFQLVHSLNLDGRRRLTPLHPTFPSLSSTALTDSSTPVLSMALWCLLSSFSVFFSFLFLLRVLILLSTSAVRIPQIGCKQTDNHWLTSLEYFNEINIFLLYTYFKITPEWFL